MSDTPKQKKYKIVVMAPAGDSFHTYENTLVGDQVICDGETNILMSGEEIQAVYPARYTIIELIK